jgi:protein phosphatase
LYPSSIFKESLTVSSETFLEIIGDATKLLEKEKDNGNTGNPTIQGHLVKLEPKGDALIVGDLHGNLESLKTVLEKSGFLKKIVNHKDAYLIFLGDYGDRGAYSVEVYSVILSLKLAYPKQVILLRGNHEAPKSLMAYPHDLPLQLRQHFPNDWKVIYEKMFRLFNLLYNAVYVEGRYLMVHGGVSPQIHSLEDIAKAKETSGLLEILLWSDPEEVIQEVAASARGAGILFGKKVTLQVLEALNLKVLIRGHEACEQGFKINHDGKVLTVFSTKGEPYFNSYAAYLTLPLKQKIENAYQLCQSIVQY